MYFSKSIPNSEIGRTPEVRRAAGQDDLGDRQIHVDLGLEEIDRDPRQRLALDVKDVADFRGDRVLAIVGDALLHLLRGQAGVLPNHRDHRDVDRREDITLV